jgi:hypothetical protein
VKEREWFTAQIGYYQRCLIEGRDPTDIKESLAARRDSCLARLFDAVDELHDVHGVPADEIEQFVRVVLRAQEDGTLTPGFPRSD